MNTTQSPQIKSATDLRRRPSVLQTGNTSDLVARKLQAEGAIEAIKYYAYHRDDAGPVDDLCAGHMGALVESSPVISWLVKDRHDLAVHPGEIQTHEKLWIWRSQNPTSGYALP